MALYYPRNYRYARSNHRSHRHVHFIAALLLAAVVLVVTLSVRDHKPPPQPHYDNTPMTAPPPR
jgi:hypothetical protein